MILSDKWLVLYPVGPELVVPQPQLFELLSELGLAGEALQNECFAVGEQFLSHVCFLGCSPAIELEPQPDQAFCYIRVPEPGKLFSECWPGRELKVRRKSVLQCRTCIVIGNIYESEAVPESALLTQLEAATGGAWNYAYVSGAVTV